MSIQEPSHFAEEDMVLVAGSDYIRMASIGGGMFSIKLPTAGDSTPIVENIDGDLIAVNGGTYVDQGRLAVTQIRESGEGTGLPLPNNVLMYDPNGNPKEITYSNDIPLHLSTIDVSLNVHDASMNLFDISVNIIDASLNIHETSLNLLDTSMNIHDVSLNVHDGSLNSLNLRVTNVESQGGGGASFGSTISIGSGSTATGTNSVAIGNNASTSTYNNAVAIGNGSTAGADNTFILGDGTQKVGIGTSTPESTLDLSGDLIVRGGTSTQLGTIQNAVGNNILIEYDGSGTLSTAPNGGSGSLQGFQYNAPFILRKTDYGTYGMELRMGHYSDNGNFYFQNQRENQGNKDLCLQPAGGNVGIGTTSPEADLHIKSTGDITLLLEADSDNVTETDNPVIELRQDGGLVRSYFGHASGSNNITIGTSSAHIVFATKDVDYSTIDDLDVRMIVTATGNVGIGTTTPESKLHVKDGPICIERTFGDTPEPGIVFLEDHAGNDCMYIAYDAGGTAETGDEGLGFYSKAGGGATPTAGGGTQIMMMRGNGNVGIGTTSPTVPLHVSESTTITLSGASSYFAVYNGFKTDGNNLSKAISIKATGGIVGSSIYANSDLRIKENINDILDDSALQKLRQLNPKMYRYKDKLSRGDKTVYGFIAQEVGDILPLAVQTQEDSIPNIIQLVSIDVDHKTLHFYQGFNTQNLDASFNTLRIIDKKNKEHFVDIEEIIDASHIRVDTDLSEIMGDVDESGNIIEGNKVFVYGQRVDDFHILDKDAIFTIATAALQEVDRQLQAEKTKVATLEAKNATLETQMADVLARLSALENP